MFERLTALLGFRKPPPMALVAASLSHDPSNAPRNATGGHSQHAHFLSCLSRLPMLAPREASVRAFLEWLIELDEAGDWEQWELIGDYKTICQMTQVEAMPAKWFGKACVAHGCHRWQANLDRDGERFRPTIVCIPRVLVDVATNATSLIRNSATQNEGKRVQCARSGSRVLNSSGIPMGSKGARHRADIVSAVA